MSTLFKDWIKDRDSDTYVSRFDREEERFGWEKSVKKGRGFSSLLYNFENLATVEIIKSAYGVAKTRLHSMGLFSVGLSLTENVNATDGQVIKVSTTVMEDTTKEESQRMDVFLGEVVHEAAHVLYTDFTQVKPTMEGFTGSKSLFHYIWNVVEDEYIERSIGKDFPGYSNYLAAIKEYFLNENSSKLKVTKRGKAKVIDEVVNTFFNYIRFPSNIDPKLVVKHEQLLLKLRDLFETEYPRSTKECIAVSLQVYDLLKDYVEYPPTEESKSKEEKSEEIEDESADSEGDKGEDDEGGTGDSGADDEGKEDSEKSSSGSSDPDSEESGSDDSENSGDGTGKDDAGAGSRDSAYKPGEFDEIAETIVKKLLPLITSSLDELGEKKLSVSDHMSTETMLDLEGILKVENNTTYLLKLPAGNMSRYNAIRDIVKPAIATLANQLTFDTFGKENVLKGLRHGLLDASKIVEASRGVQTVYTTKSEKVVKGGMIALLIDESGSMSHMVSFDKRRIDIAKELGVLFQEALKRTKIETLIYGHTADRIGFSGFEPIDKVHQTFIKVYKEPGMRDKYSLSNCQAHANNRDGDAIRAVAKRIRRYTNERAYMIVISDGQPAAMDYGGYQDSRRAVLEVTKLGVIPIGIGIDVDYSMDKIYDHYVNFTDLNNFPREVGKVIRKLLKKK